MQLGMGISRTLQINVHKGITRLLIAITFLATTGVQASQDCVVLLHGLARSASSMATLAEGLQRQDYKVVNLGYASRTARIEVLAPEVINRGLEDCQIQAPHHIHFVTHSLGGILVRYYLANHSIAQLGRVVMLAPPNQGSEVVDRWQKVPGFKTLNGPAGLQLGTDSTSIPLSLGPVDFPLGIIAGNRTINPLLSLSLPNPDDGKVSVEKTKVAGMTDFLVVPHSHTFIMEADIVMQQVQHFLRHEAFLHAEQKSL